MLSIVRHVKLQTDTIPMTKKKKFGCTNWYSPHDEGNPSDHE